MRYIVDVEFGRKYGSNSRVAFYINDGLQWLSEFLVEGRDLQEHLDRFQSPNGAYVGLPKKDWLVVDFRWRVRSTPLDHPSLMTIFFDDDFEKAVVHFRGEKTEISLLGSISPGPDVVGVNRSLCLSADRSQFALDSFLTI